MLESIKMKKTEANSETPMHDNTRLKKQTTGVKEAVAKLKKAKRLRNLKKADEKKEQGEKNKAKKASSDAALEAEAAVSFLKDVKDDM